MKIIDNRYKIENMIYSNVYFESYKVTDLWGSDKAQFMKVYHYDIQNGLIEHFTKNFIELANIKHENILDSEKFSIVKTIDTKNTNMFLYYSISEYIDYPTLEEISKTLNLDEKLEILIQIILVLDFLHFKGITYNFLNPSQIFIDKNNKVKMQSLSTVLEKTFNSRYKDFERFFISSEFIIDHIKEDKTADYYSLGIVIKYLFLENFLVYNQHEYRFLEEEDLSKEQKELLIKTIKELTKKDYTSNKINLIEVLNEIINTFKIDFSYDLVKDRDILCFHNKIVGREKEISQIMKIDNNIYNNVNNCKGVLIRGDFGIGKSRFLGELLHRLKMKGRDIYSIRIKKNNGNDLLDMSNILKQSIKDTPNSLIDKYRQELSKILPELSLYMEDEGDLDFNLKTERYRIYNRISNYFKELSKDRIIYIIIDDIQNCTNSFLELLDYLFNNIGSSNIFFIFSYEKNNVYENINIIKKIKEWLNNLSLIDIKLHKLDLEEIGEIIKNILGMGYVPLTLSSILFRESEGNPRHIESLVKHLYNIGQLYMNQKGSWYLKVDDYSELYIPTNIDETMLKQLSIIKSKHNEIFKLMSIFDDFLHKKMLLKILDISSEELDRELEELIRLKLIDENLVDWGYSYSINNLELKKLIYFQLSEEEKNSLHKSAVEAILDLKGENIDFVFEELLYHLVKSEQFNRALNIVLEKVKNLENIYGSQGVYFLEKAYKIAKNIDNITKLEILENLTKVYFTKGKLEAASLYLEEYQGLSERLKDYNHLIKAKIILTDIYYIRSELQRYLEEIEEIENIAEKNNIIEGKIVSLSLKSRLSIHKGEINKGENQIKEGIKLSKEYNIYTHMGTLYNRLGVIKSFKGDVDNSIKYYEKSIEYYGNFGNVTDATRPINNIGNIYMEHYGNMEKAMENYEKGLDISNRFDIKEIKTIFLINMGTMYVKKYKYEKALEYTLEAKKTAIELQDLNSIFICHALLGKIYLFSGQYHRAYESYNYLKESFESNDITDLEIKLNYHSFITEFYIFLGQWDKALEHCSIISDICKTSNKKEYLKSQYKLLVIKYLKNRYFSKQEIDEIISKYKETSFYQDSREVFLSFSAISLYQGHIEYTFDILEEDKRIKEIVNNDFLNKIRDSIVYYITPWEEGVNRLVSMEEEFGKDQKFLIKLLINFSIGLKLFSKRKYKDSIKYFIESLDSIYRTMLKIPDISLRFSFIESRQTDLIKAKLILAIKRSYGKTLEYIKLKDINENQLEDYFDITPAIDVLGNEEFVKITQLDSYDEALNINSIEGLISRLTEDYKYNLDLIIKYVSKETLANKGFILEYDKNIQKYTIVSSIDDNLNYKINENVLKLSDRTKEGLLINNDILGRGNQGYEELLSENIRGIICVPIILNTEEKIQINDRRKRFREERYAKGYIYLETDKVFNRFKKEKLRTIFNLIYLSYINLENNKLKVESTTDKLTGVYTRKYYERVFQELISNTKVNDGSFSLFILDIDKFKNINDNYGHRKGDEVLAQLGKTLRLIVRNTDIIARYGGEEFAILLKNAGEEEAKIIAEKIRNNIEDLNIAGIDYPITVSIGISIFPIHSQFKEELVEKADQALYHAKETGRNRVCFWDYSMSNSSNRFDKLAGILTGSTEGDNRNILAMMDIIELIKEKSDLKHKVFEFLGRLLDVIEAEQATLINFSNNNPEYYTRIKFNDDWVETPFLNKEIINRVKHSKKGDFLIDWENLEDLDSLSGIPNWESIIVLPLIKEGVLKGIIYLSVPLKTKEFDFDSYNLAKCFANIFSSIL